MGPDGTSTSYENFKSFGLFEISMPFIIVVMGEILNKLV